MGTYARAHLSASGHIIPGPSRAAYVVLATRLPPLAEPEYLYLGFQQGPARKALEPTSHRLPLRALNGVSVGLPGPGGRSGTAQTLETIGLVSFKVADEYVLDLTFDSMACRNAVDLRPEIPMLLHW